MRRQESNAGRDQRPQGQGGLEINGPGTSRSIKNLPTAEGGLPPVQQGRQGSGVAHGGVRTSPVRMVSGLVLISPAHRRIRPLHLEGDRVARSVTRTSFLS
jgi:hypothetical protein